MDDWVDGRYGSYTDGVYPHRVTEIVIGKEVTEIPSFAFQGYWINKLKMLTFEDGSKLESIGGSAFNGAANLVVTELPEGLKEIGYAAFSNTKFNAPLPSTLTRINTSFTNCLELTEVSIPAGVERVSGFAGCANLSTVHLQPTNTTLDSYAFQNCTSLKSIDISNVTSLGGSAIFQNCTSLESVVVNDKAEYLGLNVFDGCTNPSFITFMRDTVPSRQLEASAFEDIAPNGTVSIPTCAGIEHFASELMPLLPEGWTLAAREHAYGDWVVDAEATCIEAGQKSKTCACGQNVLTEEIAVDPNAHAWADGYTVDVQPTCTDAGAESIHCTLCDAVKDTRSIAATGHGFTHYVSKGDATCTQNGTEEASCDNGCGAVDVRIDEDSALGHDYPEIWETTMPATCDKAGEERQTCARCGDARTRPLEALGHDAIHIEAAAPSCTETGVIEHWACKRCGLLFSDEACSVKMKVGDEVVPASGHIYKDGACTLCGAKDASYQPAEGVGNEPDSQKSGSGDTGTLAKTGDSVGAAAGALGFVAAACAGLVGAAMRRRSHDAA